MSRRRTTPKHRPDAIRFDVECDGTERRPHAVVRIAKVSIREWPDAVDTDGAAVRVEYVNPTLDPEDNDYTMPTRLTGVDAHMTRRFPCPQCSFDKPVQDLALVRLGRTLAGLGHRRVRLRELP